MINLKETVGIVGFGVVGQAQASVVKGGRYVYFDPAKKNSVDYDEILKCELITVCMPTPFSDRPNEKINYKDIIAFLSFLRLQNYGGIVMIRTTMPYSILSTFASALNIVFVPEFLRDIHAYQDIQENGTYIVGGDYDVADACAELIVKHFDNVSEIEIVSLKEACDLKMIYNVYGAFKVLFWNMVNETTKNSRKLYQLYDEYCPAQGDMAQVGMDGKLGFSGKCFPKDLEMFIEEYKDHVLPTIMQHYNRTLNAKNR